MEKCFIVTEESKYFKDLNKYFEMTKEQSKFVNKFFKEKEIETEKYYIRGDGFCNVPFDEHDQDDIRLAIIPTGNDLIKFKKFLGKPNQYDLRYFRKNSTISKEFAQKCVDEKVIINILTPGPNDYFKSLEYGCYGCSYEQFVYENKRYLKIKSDYLKADDIPKGFKEIKTSEFYQVKEKLE